ncbi:MAG: DUF2807 domain-containing protein [Desulfobacteraceae bacterium]
MMKWSAKTSVYFLLATAFCRMCFAGDGSFNSDCVDEVGGQKTEKRIVGAFDSVDIKGSFAFIISCGDDYGLEITCNRNLLPYISAEVKNRTLSVYAKKSICTTRGIQIIITAPGIRSIDASGSNDISVKGVDNQGIAIGLDGAGKLNISGMTKKFKAHLAGSNHLDAKNLHSAKSSITIAGSSEASVYASEVLDINISGVGKITYYGTPKTVLKNISGIGHPMSIASKTLVNHYFQN